jgi:hypothetical protein
MFEKSPDQLASLKVQMMDKTAYCTQRHIILLDDTAKNLKEGMSTSNKSGQSRIELTVWAENWEFNTSLA